MKYRYLLWIIPVLFSCNSTKQVNESDQLPKELKLLSWIQFADSTRDSNEAIANKDFRLLAASMRMAVLPGIKVEDLEAVKKQCRYRFLTGMGDTIVNNEHRQWWKKAFEYAKQYNAIMVKHCYKPTK